ncbi:MAG: flagellar biosynthesis anti-sigma factor FlgM [Melioribacteraceae bacterium]|nr:flagellar biosynthesis anti-sigma factor FlgM [Melioribacteraceae bacterium]
MEIKGINNNFNPYQDAQVKAKTDAVNNVQNKKSDKLELSSAAKELQSKNVDSTKVAEIKDKVNQGYYNSDEVINKVADTILKEVAGK